MKGEEDHTTQWWEPKSGSSPELGARSSMEETGRSSGWPHLQTPGGLEGRMRENEKGRGTNTLSRVEKAT